MIWVSVKMKKITILIISLISFLISGCDLAKDENKWIVGTSADNPPYEFMENGQIVGFDIDLAIEIGKHLGKEIEFRNMEFHSLLAALGTKNIDMVLAGLSITKERMSRVDFSIPYTSAHAAILNRKNDDITDAESLNGRRIGAQLGSIMNLIAHDFAMKHRCNVTSLSNIFALVEELKSGRLDGVVVEVSQAQMLVKANDNLEYFLAKEYGSSFAIAMPKDSEIKKNVDYAIKALKKDGTMKKLEEKWGVVSAY